MPQHASKALRTAGVSIGQVNNQLVINHCGQAQRRKKQAELSAGQESASEKRIISCLWGSAGRPNAATRKQSLSNGRSQHLTSE
jgi:hypothetical protein